MACKLDSAKNLFKYPRYAIPAPSEGKEVNEEDPYEVVYIDDLDKRKAAFGICFQCNEPDDNSFKFTQTHPQAIYTSRNLDFEISSDIELKLD
ncbi:699_t:CDS:2 [Rhizophagus irregularis]|nr:699_t:CDS:2 [Rhizophagus irregularis]